MVGCVVSIFKSVRVHHKSCIEREIRRSFERSDVERMEWVGNVDCRVRLRVLR